MKIEQLRRTAALIVNHSHRVLFSFGQPVAFEHFASGQVFKSAKDHERITRKHIALFLRGRVPTSLDQHELDRIAAGL